MLDLVRYKSEETEKTINEINKWVSVCMKRADEIEAFAVVTVFKDGSVNTFDESSTARSRLTLVGGIDALKAYIINKHFKFEDNK